MRLNTDQTTNATQHITEEQEIQELLLRARKAAAQRLVDYFENEEDTETKTPAVIKAAMQFTARPAATYQAIVRAETNAAIKADAEGKEEKESAWIAAFQKAGWLPTPQRQSVHYSKKQLNPLIFRR